jgi:RNA polymerase sigma-70 factor (ECF subfamily)
MPKFFLSCKIGGMETSELDDGLADFISVRPRLFGIAYRMLGSADEAEDVVQDAWMRWQSTNRSAVQNPPAFLVTTTTRLAINVAESARTRHETYVGPWLPEPVDTSSDPRLGAERGEALEFAVLLLLEKLTPTERAAYILREAFEYPYKNIAEMLQLTEANCRQHVTRARQHIADGRRTTVTNVERSRLLNAFIGAARNGDLHGLEALFASDIVSMSDGGGMVRANRVPVVGRDRCAKFISNVASHFWTGVKVEEIQANGQPCMLISRDGIPVVVVVVDGTAEGINTIMWLMRPSKLSRVAPVPARPRAQTPN